MVQGFVLLSCKDGTENDIMSQLKNERGVKEIFQTFGPYDMLVKLKCRNKDELRFLIYYKIRKMNNIKSTITSNQN